MRRTFKLRLALATILALVASASLLAGCAPPQPVALGESDSGHAVKLAVGQRLVVHLSSNPTTGYSWAVTNAGGLKQVGTSSFEATQRRGLIGAGGTETFTFSADSRGSGQLKLEYRRPWEKTAPPAKTWSVAVTVE